MGNIFYLTVMDLSILGKMKRADDLFKLNFLGASWGHKLRVHKLTYILGGDLLTTERNWPLPRSAGNGSGILPRPCG